MFSGRLRRHHTEVPSVELGTTKITGHFRLLRWMWTIHTYSIRFQGGMTLWDGDHQTNTQSAPVALLLNVHEGLLHPGLLKLSGNPGWNAEISRRSSEKGRLELGCVELFSPRFSPKNCRRKLNCQLFPSISKQIIPTERTWVSSCWKTGMSTPKSFMLIEKYEQNLGQTLSLFPKQCVHTEGFLR